MIKAIAVGKVMAAASCLVLLVFDILNLVKFFLLVSSKNTTPQQRDKIYFSPNSKFIKMLNIVNQTIKRIMILFTLWNFVVIGHAGPFLFPNEPVLPDVTMTEPAHYDFSYDDVDFMLQLIEKHRNLKPSNAFLDYGVMFFPETDPATNQLRLVAKACIIFPVEAVPLNMPGNFFPGKLGGEAFFDDDFLKTFKKDPALANGTPQAYTFTVLYENQVQVLLSKNGAIGIKAYQVKVDYGTLVAKATTSVFFNLNIINDIPGVGFGEGATFMLSWPCPPFWRG
jgi:hypothetical protein